MSKMHDFNCPFTGARFNAIEIDGKLKAINVITGKPLLMEIEDGCLKIPLSDFKAVSMLDAPETCMTLHVSRQRLSQLIQSGTLKPIYLGNAAFFIEDHVLQYKNTRKTGRPRKERS